VFSGDFVPKVWKLRQLQPLLPKTEAMDNVIENAYDGFCLIATSAMDGECRAAAIREMTKRLGSASVELENMIYERMGMSADEIIDMIAMDEVLP
jgi:hypothetical protein